MKKSCFTIIEVIASIVILTMGVAALFSLQSQAIGRSAMQNKELQEHLLFVQGIEYYLLAGYDKTLPEEIFNDPEYTVTCTKLDLQHREIEEGTDVETEVTGGRIETLRFELFYNGTLVKTLDYNVITSNENN